MEYCILLALQKLVVCSLRVCNRREVYINFFTTDRLPPISISHPVGSWNRIRNFISWQIKKRPPKRPF